MTEITLALAYYENAGMLAVQFEALRRLPELIKERLKIIVVDDGSPTAPAVAEDIGIPLKIYRMLEDIPWNQDACRNLAVKEAETEWVLLTDMDHVVSETAWAYITRHKLHAHCAYRFQRVSMPDLSPYKPHPNSWLMTRDLFNLAGGYDERFRGWYGTDGDFKGRLAGLAPVLDLKEPLIRYPREVVPDASTTTLIRKSDENGLAIKQIKAERAASSDARPLRYLTPYERVH